MKRFGFAPMLTALAMSGACSHFIDGTDDPPVVERIWFTPLQSRYQWSNLPAIHAGVVVVANARGMAAFDRDSGALRWIATPFPQGTGGAAGDVVAVGGAACVADLFGGSACVDVANGATIWSAAPDTAWSRQNAADSSAIYYGTRDHHVVARSVVDGSVKWSLDLAPNAPFLTLVSGVSLRDSVLFATTQRWLVENGYVSTGDLVAIDRNTGRELWRFTDSGDHSEFFGAPVFTHDLAIVSDVDRHSLRAIDIRTHQQRWETDVREDGYVSAEMPPALAGDTVYAGSTDTQVHAFDAVTGARLWRVRADAGALGSTAVCGRLVLVVPWTTGPLIAVDRATLRVSRPRVMMPDDELFSRIAVEGNVAYAVGVRGVYAFRCAG